MAWNLLVTARSESNHLLYVYFCRSPDTASVRAKMVYAGSKDAFSKLLEGTSVKLQCTDRSELTEEAIHEACRRF
ncbi:hypothetical protein EON64_11700 [archaeon]|nr:MAG: hypothetical protein EON64_11700 [archaeon]